MEWFQQFQPLDGPAAEEGRAAQIGGNSLCAQPPALPELLSTEGIVTGVLKSLRAKTKDGLITCGNADEGDESNVFMHHILLSECGAVIGDRLAFRIQKNHQEAAPRMASSTSDDAVRRYHPEDGELYTKQEFMDWSST